MKVYVGLMAGHPDVIFMPGVLPDKLMHSDPTMLLEELPDTDVHRLVMVDESLWDSPDYEGPNSAFIIRATCSNPEHDHYGETNYFVVLQGEMEGGKMSEEDAIGALDTLKGIYPELMEQPI